MSKRNTTGVARPTNCGDQVKAFPVQVRAADICNVKRGVAGGTWAVSAFVLAGCGGQADATAAVDCLTVPHEVVKAIGDGAPEGSGFVAQRAAAVLGTGNEIYFVAMRFDANGETDMTGVWATTSIGVGEASSVISVDGFAKQFTNWPDAEVAFEVSPAHPSAEEAAGCLD